MSDPTQAETNIGKAAQGALDAIGQHCETISDVNEALVLLLVSSVYAMEKSGGPGSMVTLGLLYEAAAGSLVALKAAAHSAPTVPVLTGLGGGKVGEA
jgi:hypothetical protein